jgi:hypothetical protein
MPVGETARLLGRRRTPCVATEMSWRTPPRGWVATETARVASRNPFGETARPRGKAATPCVATEIPWRMAGRNGAGMRMKLGDVPNTRGSWQKRGGRRVWYYPKALRSTECEPCGPCRAARNQAARMDTAGSPEEPNSQMKITIKMALAVTTISILMPCGLLCAQAAGPANQPTAAELQPLQGSWEGVLVGDEAVKVSITIAGNALHFQRLGMEDWFETTFTLPAGTYPQQLHATIKNCPEPCPDIGKVVFTIFKIEDGTLTLAGIQASSVEPPKTFGEIPGIEDNRIFRYKLKKVQPSMLITQPPPAIP